MDFSFICLSLGRRSPPTTYLLLFSIPKIEPVKVSFFPIYPRFYSGLIGNDCTRSTPRRVGVDGILTHSLPGLSALRSFITESPRRLVPPSIHLRWRPFGHLYHRRHKLNHLRHLVPSLCYRPLRPSHRQDNTQREVQDHSPTGFTIMAPSK